MRKKAWLLWITAAIITILLALPFLLFSQLGHDKFIRPYLQEMLNEEIAIPARITDVRLSWNSFRISLSTDDNSSIHCDSHYSLWTESIDATYDVAITELTHLEKLLGYHLNGPLSLQGKITGEIDDLTVTGTSDLFGSQTHYDLHLTEQQPRQLLLFMQQGNLAQALRFANQPTYANGTIFINADLAFQNDNTLSGPITAGITDGNLGNETMTTELGVELPHLTTFQLDSNSTLKGDSLQSALALQSNLADFNVSRFQLNLQTLALKGMFTGKILTLPFPQIQMQDPIHLSGSAEGTPDNLSLDFQNDLFNSTSQYQIHLQDSAPRKVTYAIQNVDLESLQKFIHQPVYAHGQANLDGTVDEIDLNQTAFSTQSRFSLAIESIEHPAIQPLPAFKLSGTVEGTNENLLLHTTSDILQSDTNLTLQLASLNPNRLDFQIGNLPVDSLLSLFHQPKYLSGTIQAQGKFTDLNPDTLQGIASIQVPQLILDHRVVQQEHNVSLPNDEVLTLSSTAEIVDGSVRSQTNLSGSFISLSTQQTRYDIATQAFESGYRFDIPELSKLVFLTKKELHGPLSASGEIHKGESLQATLDSDLLGGEAHIRLDDKTLTTKVNTIEIPRLFTMLGKEKMTETGKLDVDSVLNIEGNESDFLSGLQGHANLHASTVQVNGYDVDTLIDQFNKSKKVDLIDVGAFVLAGPLGSVLMKGLDIGGMAQGSGKNLSSTIREVRADFTLDQGIATAKDVAFATDKHRIAARGRIDLVSQQFKKFSVATLDKNGCADFVQQIGGTLDNPQFSAMTSAANVVGSLVGSVLSPVKAIADLNCTPYYQGKVGHPVLANKQAESTTSTDINESVK